MRPAIRSTRPCAILATLAGALVVAAVVGLSLEATPSLPAKIVLGISLPVLYCALIGTIRPAVRPVSRREDGICVADDDPRDPSESERVRTWRRARLAALGVSDDVALLLAENSSFSVHELKRLLGRGCPLGTALRILWPA